MSPSSRSSDVMLSRYKNKRTPTPRNVNISTYWGNMCSYQESHGAALSQSGQVIAALNTRYQAGHEVIGAQDIYTYILVHIYIYLYVHTVCLNTSAQREGRNRSFSPGCHASLGSSPCLTVLEDVLMQRRGEDQE